MASDKKFIIIVIGVGVAALAIMIGSIVAAVAYLVGYSLNLVIS